MIEVLKGNGIRASIVGELVEPKYGMVLIGDKKEKRLEHLKIDPFWQAFYDAMKNE